MGTIEIKTEWCKSCGACVSACTRKLIIIGDKINSQGYNFPVLLDPDGKCNGCALCAEMCPDVIIEVYR
jgi:2-oxoglutarate ferredoxin oxidoreductase subunit delta